MPAGVGWRKKFQSSCMVIALVVGVQWFIHWRTRPPEPTIPFPKELRDIPP